MALLIALAVFVVSVLTTAFSRLLADESKAWIPWFTRNIIRRAVARLPENQRERYQEEWTSHINEIPGEIGRLFVALGFLPAAKRMTSPGLLADSDREIGGISIWLQPWKGLGADAIIAVMFVAYEMIGLFIGLVTEISDWAIILSGVFIVFCLLMLICVVSRQEIEKLTRSQNRRKSADGTVSENK